MNENLITDQTLREFLLGRLDDEERERIEGLFLTDNEARESVLTAEQDLIEDYLEDSLSKADKESFLSLYARTDEQRRKLRITKSIKDWAFTEAPVSQTVPETVSVWSRFRRRLQFKPVSLVPIAVIVVIAIVLVVVWLNSRMEQRKHLAVEQELAQLNSPASLREVPPQMISLDLMPVAVRSAGLHELKLRANTRLVELRLPWIQKERYSTYRAEVRGPGESYTIPNLQAGNNGEIRLRLPAQMLRKGDYQIHLSGIADGGNTDLTQQYNFSVVR